MKLVQYTSTLVQPFISCICQTIIASFGKIGRYISGKFLH